MSTPVVTAIAAVGLKASGGFVTETAWSIDRRGRPGRSTTAAVEGMQLQGHRVVNQGSVTAAGLVNGLDVEQLGADRRG